MLQKSLYFGHSNYRMRHSDYMLVSLYFVGISQCGMLNARGQLHRIHAARAKLYLFNATILLPNT